MSRAVSLRELIEPHVFHLNIVCLIILLKTLNSKVKSAGFCKTSDNKSSAVAEMGDHGHKRHGPKRGEGAVVPLSRELGPHLVQCGTMWSTSVPSGVFIHPAICRALVRLVT